MRQKLKHFILIGFLINTLGMYGQKDYINVRNLPTPDCSGKSSIYTKNNWSNKDRLLVIPDEPSEPTKFSKIFKYKKAGVHDSIIKRESELSDKDFQKPLVIYGIIDDFKNWGKFDLPIDKINNGFEFKNKRYTSNKDGIFYISKNRKIYTGNSLDPIWKQQSTNTVYYKYFVFEHGLLSKLCFSDGTVVNLSKIRKTNYHEKSTKYFQKIL